MSLDKFNRYQIILASRSPRRKQLLEQLGLVFEIGTKKDVEEIFSADFSPGENAKYLSKIKTKPYLNDLKSDNKIIISADTVVSIHDEVLGKPSDRDDAIRMLNLLSGDEHEVITGVTITSGAKQETFAVSTKVHFKPLSKAEIEHYVDTYQPYDKAGAYGIQEWIGLIGIDRIEGSYFNVVGLPVQRLYAELQNF
ncbi:MAG: septum formation protein Maf [Marinilabiliaceae bacterium]|nr:septum formation protein Maf [Marinilabiliaceae bacterium]